jgi:hypothetical protein
VEEWELRLEAREGIYGKRRCGRPAQASSAAMVAAGGGHSADVRRRVEERVPKLSRAAGANDDAGRPRVCGRPAR